MKNLTKRQQEIYDFIASEIRTNQRPPSYREIAGRFGMRSPNGASCVVAALEQKGYLVVDSRVARGLRLAGQSVCPTCHQPIQGVA